MSTDFNEEIEFRLLDFIQKNYGLEVFTPGLSRTRPIYKQYLSLVKKEKIKVSIIAGTNGKGQTAQTLSYLLETAQLKTALWTSPHILSLRERFQFNSRDVGYSELEAEILNTHDFLKREHPGIGISFYEFLFLVFLRLTFKNGNRVDHLLLEVGLGGRLDAVNHFDADCTCITSISRDHQSILGHRYDQILSEKIAIARIGKPLFTQFRLDYLNELTESYCLRNEILWKSIPQVRGAKFNYFEENQKMAIELFAYLEPLRFSSQMSVIPIFKGRREEMTFRGNTLIFIGAHNIDGIRRMIELFKKERSENLPSTVLLSFSKRPTNEIEVMLKTLVDYFGQKSRLAFTSFEHPKALESDRILELENTFNKINKGMLDFVFDWKTELNNISNQKILVCGSYYFIGEVQRFIIKNS